jgi:hypothetical protein
MELGFPHTASRSHPAGTPLDRRTSPPCRRPLTNRVTAKVANPQKPLFQVVSVPEANQSGAQRETGGCRSPAHGTRTRAARSTSATKEDIDMLSPKILTIPLTAAALFLALPAASADIVPAQEEEALTCQTVTYLPGGEPAGILALAGIEAEEKPSLAGIGCVAGGDEEEDDGIVVCGTLLHSSTVAYPVRIGECDESE